MDNEQISIKVKDFERRCRESGLKLTPQRSAIYKALINTDMHPTAEDIYREVRK